MKLYRMIVPAAVADTLTDEGFGTYQEAWKPEKWVRTGKLDDCECNRVEAICLRLGYTKFRRVEIRPLRQDGEIGIRCRNRFWD